MEELTFDTIDGEVRAVKRYDYDCEYYDCYLMDENGKEDSYIGEAYSNTREELEKEINDLL